MHEIETYEVSGGRRSMIRPVPSRGWLIGGLIYIGLYAVALVAMLAALTAGGLWVSMGALIGFFVAVAGAAVPWVALVLAWLSTGTEEITVSHGVITITSQVLGFSRTRSYALADATDMRIEPRAGMNRKIVAAYAYDRGAVAFDFGARSVRFGRRLSVDEGTRVLEALRPALDQFDGRRPVRDDVEAPPNPRFKSQPYRGGLKVTMPFGNSPETLSMLVLLLLGLLPMVLIMPITLSASLAEVGAGSPYVFAIIAALTLLMVLLVVAFTLMPREIAVVADGQLKLEVSPRGVAWIPERAFDVRFIHNVRQVAPDPPGDVVGMWSDYFKQQTGQVAFGYGPEQHRFGTQIDAPEGRMIAAEAESALAAQPDYGSRALETYERGMQSAEEAAAAAEKMDAPTNPLPEPPKEFLK